VISPLLGAITMVPPFPIHDPKSLQEAFLPAARQRATAGEVEEAQGLLNGAWRQADFAQNIDNTMVVFVHIQLPAEILYMLLLLLLPSGYLT